MNNLVHFETLGCRLNQDETEGAAFIFKEKGFEPHLESLTAKTPALKNSALAVVNTCTVTGKAEQKDRRVIRLVLEKCPDCPVVVTGCYAELESSVIMSICPERIVVIPGTQKYLLSLCATKLSEFLKEKDSTLEDKVQMLRQLVSSSAPGDLNKFTLYTSRFLQHSRASIKIQDGCNNNCAFCRIHFARGKAESLAPLEVLKRIREIESKGASEVVFTGVNLSQYCYTEDGKFFGFAELLEFLIQNTSSIKFRVSSFYPQCVDEKLGKLMGSKRVQPFFHLSVQSGSSEILKKMNRPYTREAVYNAVKILRTYRPDIFISCDIIAGFPSETEDDFALTLQMVQDLKFAWIHAFPFSPRPGTSAATMKPCVPERIKDLRVQQLTEIAVNQKVEYINSFIRVQLNATVENSRALRIAMAHGKLHNESGKIKIHAVTDNFIHVELTAHKVIMPGSQIKVSVESVLQDNIVLGKEIEASGKILVV